MSDENNRTAPGYHADTEMFHNSFCFEVVIEGIDDSEVNQAFTRVSGIVSQSEAMEFMQGTDPFVRKSPGRVSFEDIQLERIWNGSDAFYAWRRDIESGGSEKKDVNVYMRDRLGVVVRHMKLIDAWPARWELPELDASGPNAATERISLTVLEVIEEELS